MADDPGSTRYPMQILPATQTLGALHPHTLTIELPTFSKSAVDAAISGSTYTKPLEVLAHEMCHWFDIAGTAWGQSYLAKLFMAYDSTLASPGSIASYPAALRMFDEDRAILFPSYYKYVTEDAPAARGPGRNLGKTNALNDADMAEFVAMQARFATGPKSWVVQTADVDWETWDLSVKNPRAPEAAELRSPQAILDEIAALDAESARVLARVRALL